MGVVIPLIILGIFKYFNFFIDSFCYVFGINNSGTLNIILPVGISFYTFQSMSYTIDVYRNQIKCEKSFINVALYISFFPQLVAGPIVKDAGWIRFLEATQWRWTFYIVPTALLHLSWNFGKWQPFSGKPSCLNSTHFVNHSQSFWLSKSPLPYSLLSFNPSPYLNL